MGNGPFLLALPITPRLAVGRASPGCRGGISSLSQHLLLPGVCVAASRHLGQQDGHVGPLLGGDALRA